MIITCENCPYPIFIKTTLILNKVSNPGNKLDFGIENLGFGLTGELGFGKLCPEIKRETHSRHNLRLKKGATDDTIQTIPVSLIIIEDTGKAQ